MTIAATPSATSIGSGVAARKTNRSKSTIGHASATIDTAIRSQSTTRVRGTIGGSAFGGTRPTTREGG
jgi:hypothetical protein